MDRAEELKLRTLVRELQERNEALSALVEGLRAEKDEVWVRKSMDETISKEVDSIMHEIAKERHSLDWRIDRIKDLISTDSTLSRVSTMDRYVKDCLNAVTDFRRQLNILEGKIKGLEEGDRNRTIIESKKKEKIKILREEMSKTLIGRIRIFAIEWTMGWDSLVDRYVNAKTGEPWV